MNPVSYGTDIEDMSRAFDTTNTDLKPVGGTPLGSVGGVVPAGIFASGMPISSLSGVSTVMSPAAPPKPVHAVCPFCGVVGDDSGKPCRQCGLENTQATRYATRSKIGPWFVWQQRNPSAPGMNWATLMSLVEKGRITPRSVVRGPTTGQLWRFAARVKGLSREFGTCWHCGAPVERNSRMCMACKRLQQPPLNPDVLLETDTAAMAIGPRAAVPMPPQGPILPPGTEPIHREVPLTAIPPSTAAPAVPPSPARAAGINPQMHSMPVVDINIAPAHEQPPVAMNDDLDPTAAMRTFGLPAPGYHGADRNKGLRRLLVAAAIALVVFLVGMYFTPQGHEFYQRLIHH